MPSRVTPMIHVADVRATARWYESIGFTLSGANEVDGGMDWAVLTFGDGRVMFSEGGGASAADRREVDLYVETEGVDDLFADLKDRVRVREEPHDTFYGMREFIIRDPNGFWITFGEPARRAGNGGRSE
jgi:uncharacterized glyoxalase superfamily protein PhnB